MKTANKTGFEKARQILSTRDFFFPLVLCFLGLELITAVFHQQKLFLSSML